MDQIVDGKIVLHYANADWIGVLAKLGVITPPGEEIPRSSAPRQRGLVETDPLPCAWVGAISHSQDMRRYQEVDVTRVAPRPSHNRRALTEAAFLRCASSGTNHAVECHHRELLMSRVDLSRSRWQDT
jgi:hypothetical protein